MAEPGRAPIVGTAPVPISIDAQGNVTPANALVPDNGSIQVSSFVAACSMTKVVPTMNPPFNLGSIPGGIGPVISAAANNVTMNYYININGTEYGPYSITVGTPATAPLPLQIVGPNATSLSQNPPHATIPAGGAIQYTNAPLACKAAFSSALVFGVPSQPVSSNGAPKLVAQPGQTGVTVDVELGPPDPEASQGGVGSGKNTIKGGH
jgi:hypothetical protein